MIKVTINDRTIFLSEPLTVLEAAKRAGITIPTLCFLEGLTPWGGCRLCLVQIERMPRLQTACTTMVADGMVVRTDTEEVIKARRAILEFLLINHPLECPVCDKAGECELQDAVLLYGPSQGRFKERKRKLPEVLDDPLIVRNMKRCILCTRCIRTCQELQGADALSVVHRGDRSVIEPFSGKVFNCEYCGNCLSACPVGALVSRLSLHEYRAWLVESQKGICGFCGVGCRILIQRRGSSIGGEVTVGGRTGGNAVSPCVPPTVVRFWSNLEDTSEPNRGLTCMMGRFGYDFVNHSNRLKLPFVRIGNERYTRQIDDLLTQTASHLLEIKDKYGPGSIAAIAGGRLTNEDAYLFGKLIRGLGSNNIDSSARTGYIQMELFFEELFGPGVTANRIQGIVNSEVIVVAGGDPYQVAPVFGVHIRRAYLKGAKVLTIGYCPNLRRHRTWSMGEAEDESLVLRELTRALIEIKSTVTSPPKEEKIKRLIDILNLNDIEPSERIKEIAREISQKDLISFVLGREILQREGGLYDLISLGIMAYLLDARIFLLQNSPNEQGLIDMGLSPDMLPGGRSLTVSAWRSHLEDIWGFSITPSPGKTLYEIIEGIEKGEIKALYVAGFDPVNELPGGGRIRNALRNLELLIVQDAFFTNTMELAHIGIPVRPWPERKGSYTNMERRIQFFRNQRSEVIGREVGVSEIAGLSGEVTVGGLTGGNECSPLCTPEVTVLSDWEVFREIGKRIGINMPYTSIDELWKEICTASSLHRGLSPSELIEGVLWPYRGEPLRKTEAVIDEWIKGLTTPSGEVTVGGEVTVPVDSAYSYKIVVEKDSLLSATISRYSKALSLISGRPFVKMALKTAETLGVRDGQKVKIRSSFGGEVTVSGDDVSLPVKIEDSLPEGLIEIPGFIGETDSIGGEVTVSSEVTVWVLTGFSIGPAGAPLMDRFEISL